MMFFTNLETDRLLLHVIGPADAGFILKQFSSDLVNRYLFDAEPFTVREEAEALIRFYTETEPRDQNRWILILKNTGEKIGTCGFHAWNRHTQTCEMGYDLDPLYWKNGYMQEALAAILDFAVRNMQIQRIAAHIFEGNADSIKTAERQGFTDSKQTYMEVFRGQPYRHRIYIRDLTGRD